jgi:hypothetical protein
MSVDGWLRDLRYAVQQLAARRGLRPSPFGLAIGLVSALVAAFVTSWLPARGAANVDPLTALSEE